MFKMHYEGWDNTWDTSVGYGRIRFKQSRNPWQLFKCSVSGERLRTLATTIGVSVWRHDPVDSRDGATIDKVMTWLGRSSPVTGRSPLPMLVK